MGRSSGGAKLSLCYGPCRRVRHVRVTIWAYRKLLVADVADSDEAPPAVAQATIMVAAAVARRLLFPAAIVICATP